MTKFHFFSGRTAQAAAIAVSVAMGLSTAATGQSHGDMEAVLAGDLMLSGGFSRATLPNAPVGGGFLTIANQGGDDRLVSASADVSERVEIHEMAMEGDVMKMRELPDGLPIPAGETVELKPGSYHLMFMGLKDALVEGETVEVTLEFEQAGEVVVPLLVGAPNAKGAGHGHMDHGKMNHGDMQKDSN